MTVTLAGAGSALPDRALGNDEFTHLDTSDEWIVQRTGIRQRYWLDEDGSLAGLAERACRRALADAAVAPQAIRHVIVATSTGDRVSPGMAVEVATRLGLGCPAAFDVAAGCSGFLYAVDQAIALIESGRAEHVLVCGAEALSRITDRTDRSTAVLLGDGAGAVVVSRSAGALRPQFALASDGTKIDLLYVGRQDRLLRMRGRDIYQHAVEAMTGHTRLVLKASGLGADDLALFVAHQANARIVRAVARRLEVPEEKVFLNVDRVANTSSASIPLALAQAAEENLLPSGGILGLAAFGAGLTWGAGVISWKAGPGADGDTGKPAGKEREQR
ncbi:ketoacyl-ACP synthase III [Amycolatopsis rhizosphaerae]|uniref:Ketoacyl-ACP synthase III n=1 Tax=Amycolatopsis rhizosphaerae TaxID=2053003 RepID=A0A558DJG3_9PSEU|nr:beta-ketoacyl-ACP synthase III [Amycolatopsis rhizosphaerae]TVT61159.1 ketoacyl-ACP synthase III [Amycolatopsis rhizosphaerae]